MKKTFIFVVPICQIGVALENLTSRNGGEIFIKNAEILL